MANATIKIRETEKERCIGHSNIYKKLSDHTPAELINLGIIARQSNSPLMLGCFEVLPTLEDLIAAKTDTQIAAIAPVPAPAATVAQPNTSKEEKK